MLSFQESIKLTQELLAAVDEGELATVVKLLKNPELSVNVTNKVRGGEGEREGGGREGGRDSDSEKDAFFFLCFLLTAWRESSAHSCWVWATKDRPASQKSWSHHRYQGQGQVQTKQLYKYVIIV